MVPALNSLRTVVACLGNHDLDFGVPQFQHLARQTDFPWLCANVLDPALGDKVPLGNCQRTVVVTSSTGKKVGFIGLVEREWLDTCNSLPPDLIYQSASATATELAPGLRQQGCDMIVVLSHQREPNDRKLAEKIDPGTVDIVLGGHDHYYRHEIVNGTAILRSGSDFKQLSYIEARPKRSGPGWDFNIVRRDVTSDVAQDESAVALMGDLTAALKPKLEKPIGYTFIPLDARFTTVRMAESNMGNFICDLMRLHYHADCALMAAGTIRGDQVYPPGLLRVRDVMDCFPFEDPCVVIDLSGSDLRAALENGVSKYPALEGRFLQVSGLQFSFSPSASPGQRVRDVSVADGPLDPARQYRVVTRDYMVRGKDGFTSLMTEEMGGPAKSVVGEENGVLISTVIRQYFTSLRVLRQWKALEQPATSRSADSDPCPSSDEDEDAAASPDTRGAAAADAEHDDNNVATSCSRRVRNLAIKRRVVRKWWRLAGLQGQPKACDGESEAQNTAPTWTKGVSPELEGRIRVADE